mmetsp:Transcript_33216/g.106041  ORF Transcript_33216/g.106041 Transcript_33216/m.106041 type:complete len:313 (+) Transcript_33216:2591-3529(+)
MLRTLRPRGGGWWLKSGDRESLGRRRRRGERKSPGENRDGLLVVPADGLELHEVPIPLVLGQERRLVFVFCFAVKAVVSRGRNDDDLRRGDDHEVAGEAVDVEPRGDRSFARVRGGALLAEPALAVPWAVGVAALLPPRPRLGVVVVVSNVRDPVEVHRPHGAAVGEGKGLGLRVVPRGGSLPLPPGGADGRRERRRVFPEEVPQRPALQQLPRRRQLLLAAAQERLEVIRRRDHLQLRALLHHLVAALDDDQRRPRVLDRRNKLQRLHLAPLTHPRLLLLHPSPPPEEAVPAHRLLTAFSTQECVVAEPLV